MFDRMIENTRAGANRAEFFRSKLFEYSGRYYDLDSGNKTRDDAVKEGFIPVNLGSKAGRNEAREIAKKDGVYKLVEQFYRASASLGMTDTETKDELFIFKNEGEELFNLLCELFFAESETQGIYSLGISRRTLLSWEDKDHPDNPEDYDRVAILFKEDAKEFFGIK